MVRPRSRYVLPEWVGRPTPKSAAVLTACMGSRAHFRHTLWLSGRLGARLDSSRRKEVTSHARNSYLLQYLLDVLGRHAPVLRLDPAPHAVVLLHSRRLPQT